MKRYQKIAQTIGCIVRCEARPEQYGEWIQKHKDALRDLLSSSPSGSGFDEGARLSGNSTEEKLIFETSFHHMNDVGYYTGWTSHLVTLTPSFVYGFNLKVSGRNHREIKDYIGEVFHNWLSEEMENSVNSHE